MNSSQSYEFQPPANLKAIRSNIVTRIKQRNKKEDCSMKNVKEYLDNGLPSPPIESCNSFEQVYMTLPSSNDSPPSPVPSSCSSSTTTSESSEAIRERIKLLKQEKHTLFQTMKSLLSEPVSAPSTPISSPLQQQQQLKSRPIIRSRSISHNTEYNSKPRYYRSPPRYYRPMYSPPLVSPPMSRRLSINNNNNNIPPRLTSTSSFRPRLERHSRY